LKSLLKQYFGRSHSRAVGPICSTFFVEWLGWLEMGRTHFVPSIAGRQAGMKDTDVYFSNFHRRYWLVCGWMMLIHF